MTAKDSMALGNFWWETHIMIWEKKNILLNLCLHRICNFIWKLYLNIVTSHSNYCMKFSDLHGLTYYQIRFLDDDTRSWISCIIAKNEIKWLRIYLVMVKCENNSTYFVQSLRKLRYQNTQVVLIQNNKGNM